ncbi:uncharacterized protein LOC111636209 isoform X3 [Centruroides sculpturatus]|uniref:uncharacterized protein LOC111636209 isoform X2 n=1 Tax=Centruroides sculpturatus TaxID=218467 RepID=UPI000C6DF9B0|nr:uncharacterized protein LOC111636209 isoform X2 [Centruroides sculpturatus]XP_023237183.1 uncharacterized protein LOC111636209 isoform X3 [Centruroides sculpturatus]
MIENQHIQEEPTRGLISERIYEKRRRILKNCILFSELLFIITSIVSLACVIIAVIGFMSWNLFYWIFGITSGIFCFSILMRMILGCVIYRIPVENLDSQYSKKKPEFPPELFHWTLRRY